MTDLINDRPTHRSSDHPQTAASGSAEISAHGCPARPAGFVCIALKDVSGPTCPVGHSLRKRAQSGAFRIEAFRPQPVRKGEPPVSTRRLRSDAYEPGVR